jgi:RHS repeat-associated protein
LRVKKVAGGTTTVYIFSGSKVIAEYDNGAAPGSPSREYIYSGASLLAKIEGGASTYYHPDHLSNRVLTDSSGNLLGQRGNYPFGDTWYESGTTTKLKFTSYERDSESTNDYAMARSYINRFARFSSPDPLAGSLENPQSLNLYVYTENDPGNLADPSGLFPQGPPQYVCSTMDPFGLGCKNPGLGGAGGGGACYLDGIQTPCGIVFSVIQADATTSSITGSSGEFQVWTPTGCVTANESDRNPIPGQANNTSSINLGCQQGYWTTATLNAQSLGSNGGSGWAFAAPWYFQPKGGNPATGPYRPNVGPPKPTEPINPTEPAPQLQWLNEQAREILGLLAKWLHDSSERIIPLTVTPSSCGGAPTIPTLDPLHLGPPPCG